MKQLIQNFPEQLQEALAIADRSTLTAHTVELENVVITGLGGSGIGGTISSLLVENTAVIPVFVNKKYRIPAFVNKNSLVIVSSYSGNTEETLNALDDALAREAKIVCITSGGKVAEAARAKNLDLIIVPAGMPPRACLGYSLVQLLHILSFFKVTPVSFHDKISKGISLLKEHSTTIQAEAKLLAGKLQGKIPVIYSSDRFEGVAIRFRQQLNENSKMLAWHHVFPELNHNELVGWRKESNDLAIVVLRNKSDFQRIVHRIEISKDILKSYCNNISEVHSLGDSETEEMIYLIHFADWVSYFLAEINNVDPIEVKVIDHLKSELAEK